MFCTTCGNELNDKAVICPRCGCAVKELATTSETPIQKNLPIEENDDNKNKHFSHFSFISFILSLLPFFTMFATMYDGYYSVGYTNRYYISLYSYSLNEIFLFVIACVFIIISSVLGIIGLTKTTQKHFSKTYSIISLIINFVSFGLVLANFLMMYC